MDLWYSGVPGFCIGLKLSSLVSFLILALWLCNLSPRSVYFISCLISVYFLVLWYSIIVPSIHVMDWFFSSALSKSFFKVKIRSGFIIGSRSFIHWAKFDLSLLKGRTVMGIKFIYLLFINKSQTTAAPLFQSNCCSSIPITSRTWFTCSIHSHH